ncbi:MAG: hypothetical protein KDJ16_07400, partial [Hyphomicrobiales bacterium]|nr:hypothetical protein [Hyphomicrobiales bacterium]
MGSEIVLSKAIRSNLLSLQNTAALMDQTQERLATGLKVNSALDDPTAFFTASSLNGRASDLSRLMDFVSNAIQTLEAADNGIEAITSLVESAEASARQAMQSAGTTASVRGTVSGLTATTDITTAFTDNLEVGDTITVNDGVTTATHTVAANDTIQDVIDTINNTANLEATASLTSDGKLQIEATGTTSLTIGGTASATELAELGLTAGTTAAGALNSTRTSLASQFNELLNQIDQLAGDASFNGINLLDSDSLTVFFNEDGTASLSVAGVDFDAAGLGINAVANDFQTDAEINNTLDEIDSAIRTLRDQASKFGSNLSVVEARQEFT